MGWGAGVRQGPASSSLLLDISGAAPLRLVIQPDGTARLPALAAEFSPRRVVVVATERALGESGVIDLLAPCDLVLFRDVTPNPTLATVLRAARVITETRPDVVVGVGGGSTLDVAKAARLMPVERAAALAALNGDHARLRADPPTLVLLPTTAGSGSEVTRFATVYVDTHKRSLDHPAVRANVALVDPRRTYTSPPAVTYPCAFDALAHAVESLWSMRSSSESRELATASLCELADLTGQCLRQPTAWQRHRLSVAATTAGRAIDISRTTAGHAFSYWLTSRRSVPHGLACVLNLLWLLPYNARHVAPADRQRLAPVHELLGAAGDANLAAADAAAAAVGSRISAAGYPKRLGEYGVKASDLREYVEAGLCSRSRAENNPAPLDFHSVCEEVARHL